eukprot:366036-Chlamydomonas_euryale.AAC.6
MFSPWTRPHPISVSIAWLQMPSRRRSPARAWLRRSPRVARARFWNSSASRRGCEGHTGPAPAGVSVAEHATPGLAAPQPAATDCRPAKRAAPCRAPATRTVLARCRRRRLCFHFPRYRWRPGRGCQVAAAQLPAPCPERPCKGARHGGPPSCAGSAAPRSRTADPAGAAPLPLQPEIAAAV